MKNLLTADILDQIDFSTVLEVERATLSKINDTSKQDYLWQRLEELLYTDFNLPIDQSAEIMGFRSLDRSDYEQLFDAVLRNTNGSVIRAENYRQTRQYANQDAAQFVHDSTILMRYIDEPSTLQRSCLYVHLCLHFWVVEKLFSNHFSKLVLFGDMQSVENLAVQLARIFGIKTATMQHGLYVDYGTYNTINVVNYLNHNSDYFLAWGEETKSLIEKHRSNAQVVICGNPTLAKEESTLSSDKVTGEYILVVLDQVIFKEQNLAMLKCVSQYASRLNIPVAVRCHPSDNKQNYFTKIPGLVDDGNVSKALFVVGHTTTLLFEILARGIPTVQFVSDIPRINLPGALQFNDVDSLAEIELDAHDFLALARHYVASCGEQAEIQYRSFFSQIF
ncbi:hypothetical protein [uncultured Umboniibacter sp.]|uniref:hypothetical protein n=1 Tax=uncultured Umboniibacter sp. TaxID=1798917 RepID=UPI002603D036|nr:hypothetical protein [uncultured Umboniibacter sp.]